MSEYPNVRRVHDERGGSHIEPSLDQEWSDLDKLRWHASVATHDTGVRFLVHPMSTGYSVQVGQSSASSRGFWEAWSYISAASVGAEQAQR